MSPRILITDDEPDIRTFLRITLEMHDFDVIEAGDGQAAVEQAIAHHPDLIVMDVMMPRVDGVEACRRLRADGRTTDIPIIMVTAKALGTDKIAGFEAGADDYVTKPFDPDELVARVRSTLRRVDEMRGVSPLTGLPGNVRIQVDLDRRVRANEDFALLYADLNEFKAFNDHYGWVRGDEVIKYLATVIAEVRRNVPAAFTGHVGGDDFIVIVPAGDGETVAQGICEAFDAAAHSFYDDEDAERGFVEVTDRRGAVTRVPLVSVSIGIAHTGGGPFAHPSEAVSIATDMKSYAKKHRAEGSNWAMDQRSGRSAGA